MAAYDTPLITNSHPVPNGPTKAAARAGPKIREPVITAVFRLIAFDMSCSGTSSVTSPRRAGLSIAPIIPSAPVRTNTIGMLIMPVMSQIPSTMACDASKVCVMIVVRWRL